MPKIKPSQKTIVYQVFTRLFGNTNTTNKPWGTCEENGVGKFSDFSHEALSSIADMGVTHIWFTGIPHHALVGDYQDIGVDNDHPDVVKGRAGSPYAVKDYYNVNPDLADDPNQRLKEFEALIARTHRVGLKVIIDIVPNHIARQYKSLSKPKGVKDFGADDDTSVEYHKHNNFYYIPNSSFELPDPLHNYQPLGGEDHGLKPFHESPAKWTGNGSRDAKPHFYDWYETVKVNYGVRPDGQIDFPNLPETLRHAEPKEISTFWNQHDLPNSWHKFKEIALYWLSKGVDGFRYDMAGMVPVEFWSYLNTSIKTASPDAFVMAEIYERHLYQDFIEIGRMDALYDKVDFYDTLKGIVREERHASDLIGVYDDLYPIDKNMLRFLENHDEQRIPCSEFAGDANIGLPAMTVSTLMGKGPVLHYFGQEFGEAASEDAGFGHTTRTTIFDYWGFPWMKRWKSGGSYDGKDLTTEEKTLRNSYATLLRFSRDEPTMQGKFYDCHRYNLNHTENYYERVTSFCRWNEAGDPDPLLCLVNFSKWESYSFNWILPPDLVHAWQWKDGESKTLKDVFTRENMTLNVTDGKGFLSVQLKPCQSLVLKCV